MNSEVISNIEMMAQTEKNSNTTLFSEFYSIFLKKMDIGLNSYETNIRFHITLH